MIGFRGLDVLLIRTDGFGCFGNLEESRRS